MASVFNNEDVKMVSQYLQYIMNKYKYDTLSADECAELLNASKIILNNTGPKPGFNFRQMLRDGREGYIDLVSGAYQVRPNTKWIINRISNPHKQRSVVALFFIFRCDGRQQHAVRYRQ